jgi:hypothetical protein
LDHRRAENRVAAFGLGVEEEPLKSLAETALDDLWQIAQDLGRDATSHEDDLNPIRRSFDDELQISKGSAVRSVGVGRDAGFTNGLSDFKAGFVDQRMMNAAVGAVDDAMAAGLKESNLRILGLSAYGQSRAMAVATSGGGVDGWRRQTRGCRQFQQLRPRDLWQIRCAKARTAGAWRSMGAVLS